MDENDVKISNKEINRMLRLARKKIQFVREIVFDETDENHQNLLIGLKREIAVIRNNNHDKDSKKIIGMIINELSKLIKKYIPPQFEEPCAYCGEKDPSKLTKHHELYKGKKTRSVVTVCEKCHKVAHNLNGYGTSHRFGKYYRSIVKNKPSNYGKIINTYENIMKRNYEKLKQANFPIPNSLSSRI